MIEMVSKQQKTDNIIYLRRGGLIINTSAGAIQYGVSPETIKDTIKLDCGVPEIFLVSDNMFSIEQGISTADLEFPIYYNYFFQNKKVKIICTEDQKKRLEIIIKEAVFGPPRLQFIKDDFISGEESFGYPDFRRELNYFRINGVTGKKIEFSDIVEFIIFDENKKVIIDNVIIDHSDKNWFEFIENDECTAFIPSLINMKQRELKPVEYKGFKVPDFGFSIIGSGTGFDPNEMTSGFILWINKHGILVDPPVNTTLWLKRNRINPKLINTIIITHCHADHDAGTLQKIFEEGRVKIVTTKTIMDSFSRKYRALLNISKNKFSMLFDFQPVKIGEPISFFGGIFNFKYSLHAVPTIMFEVKFGGKSLLHTADHANNPELIKNMYKSGILTESRMLDLLNFSWDHDIILHEAGPPPIHTPLEVLLELPDDVKKNIRLVHVKKDDIKPSMGLEIVKTGLQNTYNFKVSEPEISLSLQILDALTRIDFFSDLNISMAKEFLELVKIEKFENGDIIIEKNTTGNKFYMILDGIAAVSYDGKKDINIYGKNDYFGETSLVLNQKRNAHVIARSELTAVTMLKNHFIHFLKDTSIIERFRKIAVNRELKTWELFNDSKFLSVLSNTQKTDFQAIIIKKSYKKGEIIFDKKSDEIGCYLIDSGNVELKKMNKKLKIIERGDIIGCIPFVCEKHKYTDTAIALKDTTIYFAGIDAMLKFLKKYPGVLMHFDKIYNDPK